MGGDDRGDEKTWLQASSNSEAACQACALASAAGKGAEAPIRPGSLASSVAAGALLRPGVEAAGADI